MSYSVDDMCKAGCATRRAIRFWEDEGLLGHVERTEGNQRRYTAEQLDKARVIAAAQFGGWQLSEIKEMVGGYDGEAREAILQRLADQAQAAARLAEMLPAVASNDEYEDDGPNDPLNSPEGEYGPIVDHHMGYDL